MEEKAKKVNSEQFNWLMSIPEKESRALYRTMKERNLNLVWHDDRHAYVLEPADRVQTMENRIREISRDIKAYKQTIENAEGALVEAERELDEILEECYGDDPALQTLPPDAE